MYLPQHCEETHAEELHRVIREYPLGVLVVHGPHGLDAQNYSSTNILLLIFCGVAVTLVTSAIILVNKIAYRKIDELEEL